MLAGWELWLVGWLFAAFGRERQSSLMRRSSKSRHVGMMSSIESDQTMSTRSSRCWRACQRVRSMRRCASVSAGVADRQRRQKEKERRHGMEAMGGSVTTVRR